MSVYRLCAGDGNTFPFSGGGPRSRDPRFAGHLVSAQPWLPGCLQDPEPERVLRPGRPPGPGPSVTRLSLRSLLGTLGSCRLQGAPRGRGAGGCLRAPPPGPEALASGASRSRGPRRYHNLGFLFLRKHTKLKIKNRRVNIC